MLCFVKRQRACLNPNDGMSCLLMGFALLCVTLRTLRFMLLNSSPLQKKRSPKAP